MHIKQHTLSPTRTPHTHTAVALVVASVLFFVSTCVADLGVVSLIAQQDITCRPTATVSTILDRLTKQKAHRFENKHAIA